jgi:hypothetical protein
MTKHARVVLADCEESMLELLTTDTMSRAYLENPPTSIVTRRTAFLVATGAGEERIG